MSRSEVEELLGVTRSCSKALDSLQMSLQIERGVLDPLENFDHHYEFPLENKSKHSFQSSEKVTIVLDPNKGIYSLDEKNSF